MFTIETSFKKVGEVAFSADGRLAALSGGSTWECEVWPLPPDPEEVWPLGHAEPYSFGLAFDPRTNQLLHADAKEGLAMYSREQSDGMEVPGGPLRAFTLSPSGDGLVCGCELWNGVTKRQSCDDALVSFTRGGKKKDWAQAAVFEGDGFVFSDVAFFADGKRFASIEWSSRKRGRERVQGDVPTLRVHDAKSLDADETEFKKPANGLAVCGKWVIVRGEKSFRVWDADDLEADATEVKTGKTPLGALAADPRGRFVLTAAGDSVGSWDAGSWAASKTFDWKHGKITCLAVGPDGLTAAAGTATGKVIVWDTE